MIILIFVGLISFVILSLSQQINSYALKKEDTISVSIILPKHLRRVVKKTKHITSHNILKQINKPEPSIKSLFSKVWTKTPDTNITKRPEKLDNKIIQALSKKISLAKTVVKKIAVKTSKITIKSMTDTIKRSNQTSLGEKVNKYRAKIQAILYNNFVPPPNTQGQSTKILLNLSADGVVLDFRVLIYSGNKMFNNEINRFKEKITEIIFPKNPQNKSGEYMIILTAKSKK